MMQIFTSIHYNCNVKYIVMSLTRLIDLRFSLESELEAPALQHILVLYLVPLHLQSLIPHLIHILFMFVFYGESQQTKLTLLMPGHGNFTKYRICFADSTKHLLIDYITSISFCHTKCFSRGCLCLRFCMRLHWNRDPNQELLIMMS
jgi:hypothetical protein